MTKPSTHTAIAILRWLADMCAPDPGDTINTAHSIEERVAWLSRSVPRPWLPVDCRTMREPWLLAEAGLIELQHRGPSVLHVSKAKVSATCYPMIRLSDLGVQWIRLALTLESEPKRRALGEMIEQALAAPSNMPAIIERAVAHGLGFARLPMCPHCDTPDCGDCKNC